MFCVSRDHLFKRLAQLLTCGPQPHFEREALALIDGIRETVLEESLTWENECSIVRRRQKEIVRLMDLAKNDPRDDTLHKTICNRLNELLLHIRENFTEYFDTQAQAPQAYIQAEREKAISDCATLRKRMEDLRVPEPLADTLLQATLKIANSAPGEKITFHEIAYREELNAAIRNVLDSQSGGHNVSEALRDVLCFMNYNGLLAIREYSEYLSGLLKRTDTQEQQMRVLLFESKRINQCTVKPGVYYFRSVTPLKEQLSDYVNEEIRYLRGLRRLSTAKDNASERFKLKVNAPVAELAYLLRVFFDTRMIRNSNVTEVIRFFARYASTRRVETVSDRSIRTKFYCADGETRRAVRVSLLAMIGYIDKN